MAKILFLTSRFPLPADKGDKLRVYHQLVHLCNRHEVFLFALCESPVASTDYDTIAALCHSVHCQPLPIISRYMQLVKSLFSGLPFQVAYFYDKVAQKKLNQLVDEWQPDYIHCHLIRTTEYIRNIKGCNTSLDFMDAFGEGMAMRAAVEKNPLKRLIFNLEKCRLFLYEREVFAFIDRFCIISGQDRKRIPSNETHTIQIVRNGVDFSTFYPRDEEKRYDLLFMGNLDYPPNIIAIEYLAQEIMPRIISMKPDIRLLLAGAGASGKIRRYQSPNIDVILNFKDISDSISWSKVLVAPMITSIGLQNKIIQAMAMKVPCVVSRMANQAIGAPSPTALIEADTAGEYSRAILELLDNEPLRLETGLNGYSFVKEHFDWIKCTSDLEETILGHPPGIYETPVSESLIGKI